MFWPNSPVLLLLSVRQEWQQQNTDEFFPVAVFPASSILAVIPSLKKLVVTKVVNKGNML